MRGVVGAAALAGLVMCAGPVRAGDDDISSMYDKFMDVIGLRLPGSGEGIEYSERSPLVVPPTKNLPQPATTAAVPAPNWPKDPDVKRRLKAKEDKKVHPHPDYVADSQRPLRPDELSVPGANTGPQAGGTQTSPPGERRPKGIFSMDFWHKEEYATFTGEPARSNLTDPPAGYLTPSPDQPYGITPEKKKYEIPTVASRMEAPR